MANRLILCLQFIVKFGVNPFFRLSRISNYIVSQTELDKLFEQFKSSFSAG